MMEIKYKKNREMKQELMEIFNKTNNINFSLNRKTVTRTRALFIILNLIISIIAFSFVVSADVTSGGGVTTDGGGSIGTPQGGGGTDQPPGTGDTGIGDNPPDDPGGTTGGGGDTDTDTGGGDDGGGGGGGGGDDGGGGGGGGGWPPIGDILRGISWQSVIQKGAIGAALFGTIGSLAGGDEGAKWGAIAGGIGGAVAGLLEKHLGETPSILLGIGVATVILILTYKKKTEEVVEFHCLPWQAPIGGEDCQLCNEYEHCSEYMCKSLGQACDIINAGTEDQKCIWKNPHDVNSPIIKMIEVSKDHKIIPDKSVRPPATGVIIERENQKCIQAFFPLEFTFITRDKSTNVGEPSQCKIDYNLTKGFEEMQYFVGGDNLFKYNHTEKLSLPGPSALNAVAPELKNDGDYTLFIRCQDANGNFNQDAFSVSFCVDKGPDTTPPLIVNTNVPSGNPVKFNQTSLNLEVYVNEPSECKWSREDRDYNNMENNMKCSTQIWEMNNQQVYTCKTTLNGINDRKENKYYFKCKDQPWAEEGDRNENKQSYEYTVIGTQPLNILEVTPNGTIFGATDTIPVFLEIKTDNGYKNGEALCYYYNDVSNQPPNKEEDYVMFHDTKANIHKQRQDLPQREYVYYFKCIDLGGNAEYTSTKFMVEVDRKAPLVVRAYRVGDLKIITNENAECSYSHNDCNFEIESGIKMNSLDSTIHTAEWIFNRNYYIRCKDKYDNQPNPNFCSITVRPSLFKTELGVKGIVKEFDFSV